MHMSKPIGDWRVRFVRFVDKSVGEDACWPWIGGHNGRGYGRFGMGGRGAKQDYAHRVAWLFANGPIPDGMHVCHRCDNPPCCNPRHLFLGTVRDNALDKGAKGRHHVTIDPGMVRGERNPNATIGWEQVRAIRRMHADGAPKKRLARIFGIGRTTVGHIIAGRTWRE